MKYLTAKESGTLISLGMLFLLLVVLLWPLLTIWALNTLFGFAIKYTFWNWLACWILVWTLQGALKVSRKSSN